MASNDIFNKKTTPKISCNLDTMEARIETKLRYTESAISLKRIAL